MTHYKVMLGSEIHDETGRQIAVVVPLICTRKLARQIAAYAVEMLNNHERAKAAVAKRKQSTEGAKP